MPHQYPELSQTSWAQATDLQIIEQVIAGNTAFFELLVRRYNSLLYRIARTHGLNHEDAEDLMQDVHVSAYCQLRQFRAEASYKTWLAKIAIHRCYHKLQSAYLKHEQPDSEKINLQFASMPSAQNQQPERMMANRELAGLLEESLHALPQMYRQVFLLREIEGFSVAETATLMDITPVNVKVRLNRAKMLLRKNIEHFYSSTEIFEFNLRYCDKIVQGVFEKIAALQQPGH